MENTSNQELKEKITGAIHESDFHVPEFISGVDMESEKYGEVLDAETESLAKEITSIAEQFAIEKADEQVIKVLKILTSEETPFSILYSDQAERFSDGYTDYTPEEMLNLLKGEHPELLQLFHESRAKKQ